MVVELIHEEGQPNLRRGRYITVLERKATANNGFNMQNLMMMDEDDWGNYKLTPTAAPSQLTGIILRVVAVEIPFIQCRCMVTTSAIQAGQLVQVDTREHVLGFVSTKYVRDMLKEVSGNGK